MYLAKEVNKGCSHYTIRQSIKKGVSYTHREVFSLGEDPSRFIHYPGGNAYYFDPEMIDELERFGLDDPDRLDDLFYDFLDTRVKRVIDAFDRGRRHSAPAHKCFSETKPPPVPLFDKRRYHFLRYGCSSQRHIERVPEKYFHLLRCKSRDEIEQYFMREENRLKQHETATYVAVIFNLLGFVPQSDSDTSILLQTDRFFIEQLCRLSGNPAFWSGLPPSKGLQPYLIRYAVMYFDYPVSLGPSLRPAFEDFINSHRRYTPPRKVRENLQEAGRLFGVSWQALKKMDLRALSKLYRKQAIKFHPDQGGEADNFRKLTHYYLLLKKQKKKNTYRL